ncbi:hypothetical protein MG293_000863 [Ovis ammon polii]|uniref:Uncharacterized protein n=1 Tax=Ovis ammon polii TaxID=230172 RepID=A0AAD4YHP0_OVIAM|nr:hypothetical protein MG293_000863 [Ovis ammon polii]
MTERLLNFDFSLSCIGEGNGNPLQYSCLENPRDGGAQRAATYGVAQSWARLKRLGSSSSSSKGSKYSMWTYIFCMQLASNYVLNKTKIDNAKQILSFYFTLHVRFLYLHFFISLGYKMAAVTPDIKISSNGKKIRCKTPFMDIEVT